MTNREAWNANSDNYQGRHASDLGERPLAWVDVCWDPDQRTVTDRLVEDYFGLGFMEYEGKTYYQLGYGEWIRLFREHEFVVEDLIELRAPLDRETTYEDFVRHEWARRWPAEHIWKVRKP